MKKFFILSLVPCAFFLLFYRSSFAAGQIISISPQNASIGDTITINGSGFGGTQSMSKIFIGSSQVYVVSSWSDSQIVLPLPEYLTPGTIRMDIYYYKSGSYSPVNYTIYGPTIYAKPGSPRVSGQYLMAGGLIKITPVSGVFGENWGSVVLDGTNINISSWDNYEIVATIPASLSPGTHQLIIKNPAGMESAPTDIMVYGVPMLEYITPSEKLVLGVSRVSIIGKNFGNEFCYNCSIAIGNIEIKRAYWTDQLISFTLPENAPPVGQIRLTVQGQQVSQQPYYSTTANYAENNPNTRDPDTSKQFYLVNIGAIKGWQIQNLGSNIVAVVDDGIYLNHPDLKDAIWQNTREIAGNKKDDDSNGFVDDIYGYNFINDNSEITPYGNHGTMVAGIIGAVKNNNEGIAGIASGVKLMPIIACDKNNCPTDAIVKGIKYAVDNGAKVINLSLGSRGFNSYTGEYNEVIRYAYNKGVVVVAAAGNGEVLGGIGKNTANFPVSPACNDNEDNMVLGVSGTNEVNKIPNWVNTGKCVDVYVPAQMIYSTTVPYFDSDLFYNSEDGTSFSSPMVAAIAAMILSKYPNMSAGDVIETIIRASTIVEASANSSVVPVARMDLSLQQPIKKKITVQPRLSTFEMAPATPKVIESPKQSVTKPAEATLTPPKKNNMTQAGKNIATSSLVLATTSQDNSTSTEGKPSVVKESRWTRFWSWFFGFDLLEKTIPAEQTFSTSTEKEQSAYEKSRWTRFWSWFFGF